MVKALRTVVDGLERPQFVRWRQNGLWWTDARTRRVMRLGQRRAVPICMGALVGDEPGGLGWLPHGELLVAAAGARLLLQMDDVGRVGAYADLSDHTAGLLGDVAVDSLGSAFVATLGVRQVGIGEQREGGTIIRVDPDGDIVTVADELELPSGVAISPDDQFLYVTEAAAARVTRFRLGGDGTLGDRTSWRVATAEDDEAAVSLVGSPMLGADGAAWCAERFGPGLWRMSPSGAATRFTLPIGFEPTGCAGIDEANTRLYVVGSRVGAATSGSSTGSGQVVMVEIGQDRLAA